MSTKLKLNAKEVESLDFDAGAGVYGQNEEKRIELSSEEREYLFLLKEMGIDIKIEQDRITDRHKLGKSSIYKHKLLDKLKDLYSTATKCKQLVQKLDYNSSRLGFDIDFDKWRDVS